MIVAELKKILEECDDDMEIRCDSLDGDGFYEYVSTDCEVRQDLYSGKYFVYIGDEKQFI